MRIFNFMLLGFVLAMMISCGPSIEQQVAKEMVEQYEIAKKQGDKIQICVQAGLVSAAFLQAKDEENYNKWKKIEAEVCKEAGIPKQ